MYLILCRQLFLGQLCANYKPFVVLATILACRQDCGPHFVDLEIGFVISPIFYEYDVVNLPSMDFCYQQFDLTVVIEDIFAPIMGPETISAAPNVFREEAAVIVTYYQALIGQYLFPVA